MDEQINSVNAEAVEVVTPQEVEITETPNVEAEASVTPEVAEPEKPQQSPEENAKFAKIRRDAEAKAQAQAKDAVIAEMFGESHGITTYAEYQKAVQAEREAARRAEMESHGIDPDYVTKMVAEMPEVRQAREILTQKQQEERDSQQAAEFFDYFEEANGRPFDAKKDVLPPDVWELKAQGVPLKLAYQQHENRLLRDRIRQMEEAKTAEETNRKNAESSPGGLSGDVKPDAGFITQDAFEANKHDMGWMVKNLSKINESRKKWA